MKSIFGFVFLIAVLAALGGCQQQAKAPEVEPLTFQRGAQLLAAGSPKSAIPFLSQTVASSPDQTEATALLALAYALDLQDERAIQQSKQVVRPVGQPAGWELVAVAIAEMTRNHPQNAIATLNRQLAADRSDSPIAPAARQWLALAYTLNGEYDKTIEALNTLSKNDRMCTSALLWMTVIQIQHGRSADATATLKTCARLAENAAGRLALNSNLTAADNQTLYDAAISAIANGDLDMANGLFSRVKERADASDTPVWMALISGIKHDWQSARADLKIACEKGSTQSRGVANQLFGVVCAVEDRPDSMIQYMLTGQRLLQRNSVPGYVHQQPNPEGVWGSDLMK